MQNWPNPSKCWCQSTVGGGVQNYNYFVCKSLKCWQFWMAPNTMTAIAGNGLSVFPLPSLPTSTSYGKWLVLCPEKVLPYLGMVGRFRSDDPHLDFLFDWVHVLCLIMIWLTPSFCRKIGLSLSHLVLEILVPKVCLICYQNVLFNSF